MVTESADMEIKGFKKREKGTFIEKTCSKYRTLPLCHFRKGRVCVQSTQQRDGKVVAFTQSRTNASKFRHDYPLTNEVRNELLDDVYTQFTDFVLREEYIISQPIIREFVESYNLTEKKSYTLEFNLFWSKVLYTARYREDLNYINHFIAQNVSRSPIVCHWLREWEKAKPSFYRIDYQYHQQEWRVTNLLTDEIVKVMLRDAPIPSIQERDIVVGTLIPIGNSSYFPLVEFYHFDCATGQEIMAHLQENYLQYLDESSFYEAFFRILSEALQLESLRIRTVY